jgi:hypothetical protein
MSEDSIQKAKKCGEYQEPSDNAIKIVKFTPKPRIIFNMHSDSNHAWAECPFSLLAGLQIDQLISKYSYINGKTVYLEEDTDAMILIEKLESFGIEVKFDPHHKEIGDSPIRDYPSYETYLKESQRLQKERECLRVTGLDKYPEVKQN